MFVDAAHGDYRVRPDSPALALGFRNFPMDQFGVQKPSLRAMAKTPKLPTDEGGTAATLQSSRDKTPWNWLGATVRNVVGLGEVSASGLAGETGVLVIEAPPQSEAHRLGLRRDHVILGLGIEAVTSLQDFKKLWSQHDPEAEFELRIIRGGERTITMDPKKTPFAGTKSEWKGFTRYDLELADRKVTVVAPAVAAEGTPWLWRGEFFGAFPTVDEALLKRGWHVVFMACPDRFGDPDTMKRWATLFEELTTHHGFSRRPVLLGMSRGGLYVYAWAAAHPDRVGLIYGDAPVCDITSWPGGKGKGQGSPRDWELFKRVYGLSEQQAVAWKLSPIDTLAPIAKAHIPILHVAGDADVVVPFDENTLVLKKRYEELGEHVELIVKHGVGHHPHSLEDPTPIVEYILKNRLTDKE